MWGYLVRRCLGALLLAIVAASLGYVLAVVALDARAELEGRHPRPAQSAIEAELSVLNLNDRDPLITRYVAWASGALQGDFGQARDGASISAELPLRLWASVKLMLIGTLGGAVAGVLLGAYAALHPRADRVFTVVSFALLAVPIFVLAVLLQLGGQYLNGVADAQVVQWVGEGTTAATRAQHLLLPTATIALFQVALYSRYQRALMKDVLDADHVRAARARGLTRHQAFLKHGLRVALIPTATYFAYNMGLLLLGATFIETAYGWHGMGEWLIESIRQADANAVAACIACAALLVPCASLLADLAQYALDPRTRP